MQVREKARPVIGSGRLVTLYEDWSYLGLAPISWEATCLNAKDDLDDWCNFLPQLF